MRRPLSWLHVLLSFALVLNGIVGFQASTRMIMQHEAGGHGIAHAQAPDQEIASQPPPCHEKANLGSPDTETAPIGANKSASDSEHTSDCCKSGTCRCECVHQSQIVIATALFSEPTIVHATSVRALKPAHAEALLPHLMRPPIG